MTVTSSRPIPLVFKERAEKNTVLDVVPERNTHFTDYKYLNNLDMLFLSSSSPSL